MNGFSSSNISYEKTENSRGYYDYWVVKLDSSGGVKWDKTIGGSNYDYAYSIKEIKPNYYNVAGFSSSGVSGDKTLALIGANDFWIVQLKYVPVAGASEASLISENRIIQPAKAASFTVYPNPAKYVLHVETGEAATLIIIDETGRQVMSQRVAGKADIAVLQLTAGIYYIKNASTNEIKKIIVTK